MTFPSFSACREGCRRAFRGILHIPGCKTICFKCVLLPCYSNNDSDDEKDKDDEGYDSYGNTDTHVLPTHEGSHDTSGSPNQATHHEYVNSVQYTNIEMQETGQAQSSDNIYVPMQLESLDHLVATQNLNASEQTNISNIELMTCKLKVECPNPKASYVNFPESSRLLKETEENVESEKMTNMSNVDVHVEEKDVASKNYSSDISEKHSKSAGIEATSVTKASKQISYNEERTQKKSVNTDAGTLRSQTSAEEIDGASGKKMVLLETDL